MYQGFIRAGTGHKPDGELIPVVLATVFKTLAEEARNLATNAA